VLNGNSAHQLYPIQYHNDTGQSGANTSFNEEPAMSGLDTSVLDGFYTVNQSDYLGSHDNYSMWGNFSCDAEFMALASPPSNTVTLSRKSSSQESPSRNWVGITPPGSCESQRSSGTISRESSEHEAVHLFIQSSSPSKPRLEVISPSQSSSTEMLTPLELSEQSSDIDSELNAISSSEEVSPEPESQKILYTTDITHRTLLKKDSQRVRKKRAPYSDIRIRSETTLTRQMNACVRCRMQRNRVKTLTE